ncbi:hypothetical protein [Yeosuana aromativorans]|uniref:hypothetical protein n=1 Tax=Yeosuana aromativorans TaxID=288019 RepID=UPI0016629DBE|nr:hypothetical protein [Yeosuana aromativorans]
MKRYSVYRNIRKRAEIMGLSIPLFALMMTSVIGSLLLIIFSFSFLVVLGVFVLNAVLYIALTNFNKHPEWLHLKKVFPKTISNKKESPLNYEDN